MLRTKGRLGKTHILGCCAILLAADGVRKWNKESRMGRKVNGALVSKEVVLRGKSDCLVLPFDYKSRSQRAEA